MTAGVVPVAGLDPIDPHVWLRSRGHQLPASLDHLRGLAAGGRSPGRCGPAPWRPRPAAPDSGRRPGEDRLGGVDLAGAGLVDGLKDLQRGLDRTPARSTASTASADGRPPGPARPGNTGPPRSGAIREPTPQGPPRLCRSGAANDRPPQNRPSRVAILPEPEVAPDRRKCQHAQGYHHAVAPTQPRPAPGGASFAARPCPVIGELRRSMGRL